MVHWMLLVFAVLLTSGLLTVRDGAAGQPRTGVPQADMPGLSGAPEPASRLEKTGVDVGPAGHAPDTPPSPDDITSAIALLVDANEKQLPAPSPVDEQRSALAREIVRLVEGGTDAAWSEAAFAEKAEEMRNRHRDMSRHVMDAMLAVIRASLRPDAMRARVEHGLAHRLDEESLRAGLQWESSALGRRVTGLQVAAGTPGQRDAMKSFVEQRMRAPGGDDPRARTCMQVGALANLPDIIVQAGEAFGGVALAAMAIDKGQPIDMMSFGRAMGAMRPVLRMVAQEGAVLTCLFVVRDMNDTELEQWLAFLRSDAGGRYARGRTAAEVDALVERAGIMFRTMLQLAPRLRAQRRA
jgi:hypothetical protein